MKHQAQHSVKTPGRLYVVATPIGHLADLSARAREVLAAVDCIAAEDTRLTRHLLERHGIASKLIAAHEHNETAAAGQVVRLLDAGQDVALVSDAGTPAISDPGAAVVRAARAAGYTVVPIPGANAATTLLSASGMAAPSYLFRGFLPREPNKRRTELRRLNSLPYPLVLYEAPHRIESTLADIASCFEPEREICLGRELTKLHEEIHLCCVAAALSWLQAEPNRSRGEYALALAAAPPREDDANARAIEIVRELLLELPVRRASDLAAKLTGANRKALYAAALRMKEPTNDQ
jgi:16S rRNA (cytidine1402-2'-O)-methyltransferase